MMSGIKKKLKELFPTINYIYGWVKHFRYYYYILRAPQMHSKALRLAQQKKSLKCVFFVVHYQTWKYDDVYHIMSRSDRFDPIILVCPSVNYGREIMLMHLRDSYNFFAFNDYNVLNSYDETNDRYVDVEKEIGPDIIFYTNPYKGLIDERYYIDNFRNTLTVYVPYAFNNNADHEFCQNLPLHNLVWRYYSESDEHRDYSVKYSRCKGRNVVATGYPGIDPIINKKKTYTYKDWKLQDKTLKRIIWAPHHTIGNEGSVIYSCFLQYCDFMLEIAEKYKERAQFVFKPHPLLKDKLVFLWGKEKTDSYYSNWKFGVNTNLNDGDYVDLFLSSDAMIHDCGSFLIEYLYVNKPVMRTLNDIPLNDLYDTFALKCLDQYYFARNEKDIENFIQNVINGIDPLKEQRTKFINEVLMPKGSPSQNIVDDILDSIDNQILYRN